MRILFVNAYFYPEIIAFSHLEEDLIKKFTSAGHEIDILCPVPTRGISKEKCDKYKNIKTEKMYNGQVNVKRFWAPREGRNPILRAFRYLWCNIRQYYIGKKYSNIDLIFAVSTPPTQGFLAGKLAKKLKCPFVYSLQDIFPDSLVNTGMTQKGSLVWRIGAWLERITYNSTDKIIVISNSMKQNILDKGVPEEKIEVISNWIDADAVKPVPKEDNRIFDELNISKDKFIVVYAGNMGAAQGTEVILEAAEKLKDNKDVQFVIFGGGSGFENAKKTVKEKDLGNVIINGLLPQNRVSEVYSFGDVAIITCKKGSGTSAMPSKTWSIMACNTPIVASFDTDSELSAILKESNAGIAVESENVQALEEVILSLLDSSKDRYSGGREYVLKNASNEICTLKYMEVLKECSK